MSGIPWWTVSSAGAIAVVIALMASVRSPRWKAAIYALPIPLTVTTIVTGGGVDGSSVVGMALVCSFLWLVYLLHTQARVPVVVASATGALAYVGAGLAVRALPVSGLGISTLAVMYLLGWAVFCYLMPESPVQSTPAGPCVPPPVKGAIVFVLALALLTARDHLAGVIITFPFAGVFAVVESRHSLRTLATIFTRRSIAIIPLLAVVHAGVSAGHGLVVTIVIGWVVYTVVVATVIVGYPDRGSGTAAPRHLTVPPAPAWTRAGR